MKTWQAASAGLVLGMGAMVGVGAIGRTEQPVGPYFQVSDRQIVSTLHVQSATLTKEAVLYGTATKTPDHPVILLYYENGKSEPLGFDTEEEAKAAWGKLRVLLGVEVVGAGG